MYTQKLVHVKLEALFIIAKMWKHPNVHQPMNGYLKCGISIQ